MNWKHFFSKWGLLFIALLTIVTVINLLSTNDQYDVDLPEYVDFNYHIRPILSQNCLVCHGPDSSTRKANLRLDNLHGATASLNSGEAAIVPGNASRSTLIERIISDDPEYQMPPPEAKKTLSDKEIALLTKWIDQGAEWKNHWAYIKPELSGMPASPDPNPAEVIDHFLDKALEDRNLTPASSASKNSLIRRISYLLTGLPPEPEIVKSFQRDNSEQAYEKMIDHYLASPHFGERWARHWMDLVRYAEHKGHEYDFQISGAWQYRDYLIRAFNEDVPYDLFVKEHLAGDMLSTPRYHISENYNESILGTAYFYLSEGKHSPVNVKIEESDWIDNVIDVTTKTFQGLTVSCARCHDHKFDPIPTADYYAMYGMIESARLGPLPAREFRDNGKHLKSLDKLKNEIRSALGTQMKSQAAEVSSKFVTQVQNFIQTGIKTAPKEGRTDYDVIGDFRNGNWGGWYRTGLAFGDTPLQGEPAFDKASRLKGLMGGRASSRYYRPGLMGALRSPNFIIQYDSVAVRALGKNSVIRIIVDNFQMIQDPLWGGLARYVNDEDWNFYTFDLSMLKGHKAYIEVLPGKYGIEDEHNVSHVYNILPEDYIEVQYALAHNGPIPNVDSPEIKTLEHKADNKLMAIEKWMEKTASTEEILLINQWLFEQSSPVFSKSVATLLNQYNTTAEQLYSTAHIIGVTEGDPVFSPVFIRGNLNQLSEDPQPHGFLTAINSSPDDYPQEGSGRLAWAESVTDPDNPLTARVMVNRIWHHLFGRGIVETVDNFGIQGKLPSHPQLLDFLALRFVEDDWSIKTMIKNIMMTKAFRRSASGMVTNSEIDPQNIFLHHYPVRRLEAEAIRDGMLAVSGNLNTTMFGEPIPIHINEFMTGRGKPEESGPLDGFGRRSIYITIRRNFLSPMMLAFDMPIPFSTFGKRNTTNVPAQSLTLLNDPFVHGQAAIWAEEVLKKTQRIEDRIIEIYYRAFSRKPTENEQNEALLLLTALSKEYNSDLDQMKDDKRLWKDYCHSIFNLKEFIHLI